jgi:hypothetical protein
LSSPDKYFVLFAGQNFSSWAIPTLFVGRVEGCHTHPNGTTSWHVHILVIPENVKNSFERTCPTKRLSGVRPFRKKNTSSAWRTQAEFECEKNG